GILGSTIFFGFAVTIANASQAEPLLQTIPEVVLKIFPYVLTLLALILFSKTTHAPRALGEPFDKGKR
ncbi:MAG: ABC transporter permease, partial [Spirochaeta sp.]